MGDDEEPLIYMPSPGQQIFLSLIGIPMSILSIIGSYFIIRHARSGKGHSAYRQIMMVASACDIVWSIAWVLQPFLSDTSLEFQDKEEVWIWAFGNSASCTFLGAMTQFGLSAHWFSGLISFYFLLTVKFRVKQDTFAKALPFLLGFIIVWSVGTAITAAVMKRFHPVGSSPGCWVGGDGFCQGDDCNTTVLLGWIIGGGPTLAMFICVVVNNLILYCHVRKTVVEGQRRALKAQKELTTYSSRNNSGKSIASDRLPSKGRELRALGEFRGRESGESNASRESASGSERSVASIVSHTGEVQSIRSQKFGSSRSDESFFSISSILPSYSTRSVLRSSDKQWKRVQEVGRQSFLYVGAYLMSFGWTFVINYLDSKNFEFKENAGNFFLPLLVLQSIGLPTMGLFNCCVYFRPKVLTVSKEFPNESRIWWIRRVIYGNAIKPTPASPHISAPAPGQEPPESLRINFEGVVPVSSLARTNSEIGRNSGFEYSSGRNISAFESSVKEECSVIIEVSRELDDSSRHNFDVSHPTNYNEAKHEKPPRVEEEVSESA